MGFLAISLKRSFFEYSRKSSNIHVLESAYIKGFIKFEKA